MRALFKAGLAILSSVSSLIGYLGSVAIVVGIMQNYALLSLSGAPLRIYEQYSHMRDQIFWLIQFLFFDWWISFQIPIILRDALILYLFFGIAYNGTSLLMSAILETISRGKAKFGKEDKPTLEHLTSAIRRLLKGMVTWPRDILRCIRSPGVWPGQEIPPDVPNEIKEVIIKGRRDHDIALMISFPLTVLICAIGVCGIYYWSYLESLSATS